DADSTRPASTRSATRSSGRVAAGGGCAGAAGSAVDGCRFRADDRVFVILRSIGVLRTSYQVHGGASMRTPRLSRYVVGVDLLPLQVLVEPGDDVLQALDAVPRLAGTRKLVALSREADHDGRLLEVLEGAEHLLAAGSRRSPVIRFAFDQ